MRFLITAGGTREYIDPVRFISNASSGRMGYALAGAAAQAGHEVVLISAAENLKAPPNVELVKAVTSDQMFEAVSEFFAEADCLIMAAAVSDYRPVVCHEHKLKKSDQRLILELEPTTDILKWAGGHKRPAQIVVGFALEDREIQVRAEEKMLRKQADMIIANIPETIGAESAKVMIKDSAGQWQEIGPDSKERIAAEIINRIISFAGKTT